MKQNRTITFQSVEMNLSYAHHFTREQEVMSLRVPKVDGLSPSINYINACAPLRSPMEMIANARRDAPKFKEQAERNTALAEKRAAIERVSCFLGEPKIKSQDRER